MGSPILPRGGGAARGLLDNPGAGVETRCRLAIDRGAETSAMITGFNTNVRHRGRLFHVQTEDSGRGRPHIISHLYFGGTILASEKSEYGEILDSGDLEKRVRALMEGQHQSMLSRLRAGGFDPVIDERLSGSAAPAVSAGGPTPDPQESRKREARAFGEGIVSKKPLDEVILEYLVEKARDRSSRRGSDRARPPARESRTKE